MAVVTRIRTGPIYFKVHVNDVKLYKLSSIPGWYFINPVLYYCLEPKTERNKDSLIFGLVDDYAIVLTRALYLVQPNDDISLAKGWTELVPDDKIFHVLLRKLRYFSKNNNLPSNSNETDISHQLALFFDLPEPKFPETYDPKESNRTVERSFIDKALTWKHITESDLSSPNFDSPIYDNLLLDAISVFYFGDYKRTILYSAMAIEVMVSTKLDEIYELDKRNGGINPNLRTISIIQGHGKIILKDPVYDYLSSKTDFSQLLHERCLYVIRRSLLIRQLLKCTEPATRLFTRGIS